MRIVYPIRMYWGCRLPNKGMDTIDPRVCTGRRKGGSHIVVLGERHLRHMLLSYMTYYNEARTHLSLNKDAPIPREVQGVGRILAKPHLGGPASLIRSELFIASVKLLSRRILGPDAPARIFSRSLS